MGSGGWSQGGWSQREGWSRGVEVGRVESGGWDRGVLTWGWGQGR